MHLDADVRAAAREAEERLNKWALDLTYRDEVYAALAAFAETEEAYALTGESRRFFDFTMRDFRMAGHELDPSVRAEVQTMRNRLLELQLEFNRNLAENDDAIIVAEDDLEGLPREYIEGPCRGGQARHPAGEYGLSRRHPVHGHVRPARPARTAFGQIQLGRSRRQRRHSARGGRLARPHRRTRSACPRGPTTACRRRWPRPRMRSRSSTRTSSRR